MRQGKAADDPGPWAPVTHTNNLHEAPGPQLPPDPVLAFAALQGVNSNSLSLSLSLSLPLK